MHQNPVPNSLRPPGPLKATDQEGSGAVAWWGPQGHQRRGQRERGPDSCWKTALIAEGRAGLGGLARGWALHSALSVGAPCVLSAQLVLQLIRINPVGDIGLQKTTCPVKMRDWHRSTTYPQQTLTVPPALVCNPFSQALSNSYGLCNFSLPCFAASRMSQFCPLLASGSVP